MAGWVAGGLNLNIVIAQLRLSRSTANKKTNIVPFSVSTQLN